MHHLSQERIWIPVSGTTGWTGYPIHVSINEGSSWVLADVDPETITSTVLANGKSGQRAVISVLSTNLNLVAQTTPRFLVRISSPSEQPVIYAGKMFIW